MSGRRRQEGHGRPEEGGGRLGSDDGRGTQILLEEGPWFCNKGSGDGLSRLEGVVVDVFSD